MPHNSAMLCALPRTTLHDSAGSFRYVTTELNNFDVNGYATHIYRSIVLTTCSARDGPPIHHTVRVYRALLYHNVFVNIRRVLDLWIGVSGALEKNKHLCSRAVYYNQGKRSWVKVILGSHRNPNAPIFLGSTQRE